MILSIFFVYIILISPTILSHIIFIYISPICNSALTSLSDTCSEQSLRILMRNISYVQKCSNYAWQNWIEEQIRVRVKTELLQPWLDVNFLFPFSRMWPIILKDSVLYGIKSIQKRKSQHKSLYNKGDITEKQYQNKRQAKRAEAGAQKQPSQRLPPQAITERLALSYPNARNYDYLKGA